MMGTRKFDARQLLKEKKFWVASFLIAWAAGLQRHMMWLQRQDSFKQKFGEVSPESDSVEAAEKRSWIERMQPEDIAQLRQVRCCVSLWRSLVTSNENPRY